MAMQDPGGTVLARHILALLRRDALDAAIEAGLPAFMPLPTLAPDENRALLQARDRLLGAWAARERHRARAARLQRIADERARMRPARQVPAAGKDAGATPSAAQGSCSPSALPPAAAAALARARARALGDGT